MYLQCFFFNFAECREYSQYAEFKYTHPIMGKISSPCPLDEPVNSDLMTRGMQEFPHIVSYLYFFYSNNRFKSTIIIITDYDSFIKETNKHFA